TVREQAFRQFEEYKKIPSGVQPDRFKTLWRGFLETVTNTIQPVVKPHVHRELVEPLLKALDRTDFSKPDEIANLRVHLSTELSVLTGREVFWLADTCGFPLDITQDIAREHGMTVAVEGFEREMEAQRERARSATRFGLGEKTSADIYRRLALSQTVFTGYEHLREESVVIGLVANGAPVERARKGQQIEVVLRETPFYAESGGQVGDTGEIRGPSGAVRISDTHAPIAGLTVHRGEVTDGEIAVGEPVTAQVDAARRADVVRNHTGTHLLHAALRKVLGAHVRHSGISPSALAEIEHIVNDKIMEDLPVTHKVMKYKEAVEAGALAFFGEKYGDIVRTCRVGGDGEVFSFELCGGTHTSRTGEIGLLHIESEGSIAAGTRRIEAVTGHGTAHLLDERHVLLESLAKALHATPGEIASRVSSLMEELERERKRVASLERDLARRQAESLPSQAQQVDGVTVLTAQVNVPSADALREMAEWLRDKLGSSIVVLASVVDGRPRLVASVTPDLVKQGHHAGKILMETATYTGGSGGGRPEFAQGGGKDASKIKEALALVPHLVKKA
ncbi:MAG: alanine--tRNA ligase, partial [Chloroflexi bacterium]|nr:alanine--tRNA ligase [Chloroflexota bacterium]